MLPNIVAMVRDDASVQAHFGNDLIVRIYAFGRAPPGAHGTYAVWQIISGLPQNQLSERPDMDDLRVQFDIYAAGESSCDAAATALRDALEPHGHQVSINLTGLDDPSGQYRIGFDFEFWLTR